MTDEDGTEEGWPVRRHSRPSEPALPWPGGDGAAPNGAVPSGSAAPGGPVSGNGPRPADYGMTPDRHGTVPNYALPPNPGGQAPGRHGEPGDVRGSHRAPDNPSASYRASGNPPISYGTPENYGAHGNNGAQPNRGAPSGGYGTDHGGYGAPNDGPGAAPGSYGTAPVSPQPRREQPARPPRALPPGRHAGQDGSADGPDRPQGSYQGMRRSPDSIDPNKTPGPGRSGAPDARSTGGPADRSQGRADPLTDPSYAWPGSSPARPAQPQPDTSGYGRPQPSSSRPGAEATSGYPVIGAGGLPGPGAPAFSSGGRDTGRPGDLGPPGGLGLPGDPGLPGYPDDGRTPRDGRNRDDRGNPRNVEDPRGADSPAGRGPARADSDLSDRGPFGDEDPPRDRGYEPGDRPPGNRPRADHRP